MSITGKTLRTNAGNKASIKIVIELPEDASEQVTEQRALAEGADFYIIGNELKKTSVIIADEQ